MNWRDGLKVNTSKKIVTNRQTKKEKGEEEDSSNNQRLANKLSQTNA